MEHINIKRPFFSKVGNFNLAMTFEIAVAMGVVLAVLFLTWRRLFYGVDFTDEAFYIALPYRFSLGDIPLKDEQNLAQLAGVLVMPFTRIFLYFQGNTDGIVLFSRHLHFVFTVLVGSSVFIATQRTLRWSVALMVSVICVVFVPFNIHGLSYNTMGCGFLTMGCFLGMVDQDRDSVSRWAYFFSGMCHCLAILVYPTLLAPVCVYAIVVLFNSNYLRVQRVNYVRGGLLAAMIPLALVLRAGVGSLSSIVDYFRSVGVQGGGWGKLVDVIVNFYLQSPHVNILLTGMGILAIWHFFKPRWMRFVLPLLPFLLVFCAVSTDGTESLYFVVANGTASLYFVVGISLLGPFVYPFVAHDKFGGGVFRLIWWPSFIGGLVTAWSSSNGTANGAIGMFPAALASTILIIRALQLMPSVSKIMHASRNVMMMATPALIIAPLLIGGYVDVYGEPVPLTSKLLTERVATGPYRGIKTTEQKNVLINKFSQDLALLVRPNDTILFFSDFPAGYLFTNARPVANTIWLSSLGPKPPDLTSTIKFYQKNGIKPSLVFLLKKSRDPSGLLFNMVKGNGYRKIFDSESYDVYRTQEKTKS
ncbi:hypothetical protein [Collimonas sp.]|uniref:hypothetical protein n=1 Tax=Collimonas sp. TaxID=1963772 RepID=UPI002CE1A50B|nr:hypothetical protein [Collimonas sp.]HWW04945.1 hypothetical protein [Collimonas sp.]